MSTMPDYESTTVTTVTRRFALQLPSNAIEVSKLAAAAAQLWRSDRKLTETISIPDDAITVTVEDDVLIYSWVVPNTEVHKPFAVSPDEATCTCPQGAIVSTPALGKIEAHALGCPRWGREVGS